LRALTLKPFIETSRPALVSKPILSISRRLKPAATISRLFLAACCFSFSAFRLVFEMFAIAFSPYQLTQKEAQNSQRTRRNRFVLFVPLLWLSA
jgi:hypothetical protein